MRKKLIISIVIFSLLVVLAAMSVYVRFTPSFPAETTICETNVSRTFVWGASPRIRKTLDAYTLTVDLGGTQRTFTADELSLDVDEEALKLLASNLQLGITDVDYTSVMTMDTAPVQEWLFANIDENRIEPVAAHLVWNPETCLFELDGGVVGEYYDANIALQIIVDSILNLNGTVTLSEADYHVEYTDTEQAAKEEDALSYANTLVSRQLTYNFYQRTGDYAPVIVSPAIIGNWLIVGEDGLSLTWDEALIKQYAEITAENYSMQGEGYFVSHDGRTIDLTVDTPTNIIDAEALYNDLYTSLVNMEFGERDVPYSEQNLFSNFDGTYIEISIGEQKLFAYKDGELFIETSVITGCMHCDHGTKTGAFKIQNKDRNIYLQGENYFVHYWMGFLIPKYGLHDADGWRVLEEYTTEEYLTDGSGGCVNIQREIIKQLYETYEVGTPVIIYDESYVITDTVIE